MSTQSALSSQRSVRCRLCTNIAQEKHTIAEDSLTGFELPLPLGHEVPEGEVIDDVFDLLYLRLF